MPRYSVLLPNKQPIEIEALNIKFVGPNVIFVDRSDTVIAVFSSDPQLIITTLPSASYTG